MKLVEANHEVIVVFSFLHDCNLTPYQLEQIINAV